MVIFSSNKLYLVTWLLIKYHVPEVTENRWAEDQGLDEVSIHKQAREASREKQGSFSKERKQNLSRDMGIRRLGECSAE